VLYHILMNSVKFMEARKGGRIEVVIRTSQDTEDNLEVSLQDNGPGIDPQIIKRLGKFFSTRKISRGNRGQFGVGLGLTIVHAFTQYLGSKKVQVTSEGGSGTRVVINLSRYLTENGQKQTKKVIYDVNSIQDLSVSSEEQDMSDFKMIAQLQNRKNSHQKNKQLSHRMQI
jgi:K+-sensing histidine kinase KdpD